MRLAEFSVRNFQFTLVIVAMAAALGINSLRTIPQAEDPTFAIASFSIVAVYPGASPEDMEQLVVDPLEARLNELDDLRKLKSESQDGLAVLNVEFEVNVDAERKHDEVVREVNALRPSLPAGLARLEVTKFDASRVNIVQLALVSEALPVHRLDAEARRLEDRLERGPGVRSVARWAAPEREVVVALDAGRLAALGIPAGRVLEAIGSEDANIPGGAVSAGPRGIGSSAGRRANPRTARGSASATVVSRRQLDQALMCALTSFVISNIVTFDLPLKMAFNASSALMLVLTFWSCRPFFLM